MSGILVFALLLTQIAAFYWSRVLIARQDAHAAQMLILAELALNHLKGQNLAEMAQARALKQNYDANLEMYRDAVAKDYAMANAKKAPVAAGPKWAVAFDDRGQSKNVDMNEFEILE